MGVWEIGICKRTEKTPFSPLSLSSFSHRVGLGDYWGASFQETGCSSSTSLAPCTLDSWSRGHTHGGDDGDHGVLSVVESTLNLLTEVSVGDLDIILGVSITVHQVEETLLVSFLPNCQARFSLHPQC
jgi:hypothetical protein